MRPAVVTGMAYLAGSIPFSNLVARRVREIRNPVHVAAPAELGEREMPEQMIE